MFGTPITVADDRPNLGVLVAAALVASLFMRISDKSVGDAVARARAGAGVSQADLARRLVERGVEGIYPSTVAKVERGQRSLKLNEASEIAEVLSVEITDLLGDDQRRDWLPDRRIKVLADAVLRAYDDASVSYASLLEMREIFSVLTVDRGAWPLSHDAHLAAARALAAHPDTIPVRAGELLSAGRLGQPDEPQSAFPARWASGDDGLSRIEIKPPGGFFMPLDEVSVDHDQMLRMLQELAEVTLDGPALGGGDDGEHSEEG